MSASESIIVPSHIADAIAKQANAELPKEACGYLAGTDNRIELRIPMRNVDASPEHFSFDPAEQFAALKTAREAGLSLIGTYHSHPETPARMSEEDIRLAVDTSMYYAIYSVAERKLKVFTVDAAKTVSETRVELLDAAENARR